MINIPTNMLPLAGFEVTFNDDPTQETISLSLFVSGCVRSCIGCQNPELQKIDETKIISLDQIKNIIKLKQSLVDSIVFSGGDFIPLFYDQLKDLMKYCIDNELKIIIYTGETYNNIDEWVKENSDIIISEPYEEDKKQNNFPASKNQKIWINGKEVEPKDLKINNIYRGIYEN